MLRGFTSRSLQSTVGAFARRGLSTVSVERHLLPLSGAYAGVINMNRPKANALNSELVLDIQAAIKELEADPTVRGLVLASALICGPEPV